MIQQAFLFRTRMATMTRIHPLAIGLAVCLLVGALTGCASQKLNLGKAMPWSSPAPTYETPEKVIAIWTDATYELPGKAPTRGFGGRVYFYNAKGDVVPVNGQLVVYAFDDSDPHAGTDQPTRKYAFTAEQLTRYYSNSELGASYNIWIPWDSVGGEERQIALFPVFIDDSGKMVRGSFANNRLPGKRALNEEERRGFYVSRKRRRGSQVISHQESGVKPAGYETEVAADSVDGEKKEPSMVTHTIRVPRSLSERMANGTLVAPGQPALMAPAQRATSAPGTAPSQWPAAAASSYPTATPPNNASLPGATSTWAAPPSSAPGAPSVYPTTPSTTPNGNLAPTMPAASASGDSPTASETPHLGQQGFIGADPSLSMSARSRAWARQDSRSAHFEQPQFRAPAAPGSRPQLGRGPTLPYPSEPLSLPRSTP
jgi:hypothetical protein